MKIAKEDAAMSIYRINFDSLEWETPLRGVRYRKYEFGNKQVRLVEYDKEFVEPDWCRKGHVGMVLDGEIEIDFGGTAIRYYPGDCMFIPPGDAHKHKARILTERARVFLAEDIS